MLICSIWNSPDRNDSVAPPMVLVYRLIEIQHKVRVKSDFRGEELRIQHSVFVAWGAIEPGKVAVGERSEVVHPGSGFRGLQGFRNGGRATPATPRWAEGPTRAPA